MPTDKTPLLVAEIPVVDNLTVAWTKPGSLESLTTGMEQFGVKFLPGTDQIM